MVRNVVFGLVAALMLAAPYAAEAGDGYCGHGYGYGWWGLPNAYSQGALDAPPYFAIHPPVYYSGQIIARPYGTSPFAWPATYMPPAAPARPMVIMNTHVKDAESHVAASQPQLVNGIQPLRIDNPFFVSK